MSGQITTDDELKLAINSMKRAINKLQTDRGRKKFGNMKNEIRELLNAHANCEAAASKLCQENKALKQELREQREKIQSLEDQVDNLKNEIRDMKVEDDENSARLQGELDKINKRLNGGDAAVKFFLESLNMSIQTIEQMKNG